MFAVNLRSVILSLALSTACIFPADSCRVTAPLSKNMEEAAQVVFYGRPSAYEIVTCPQQGKGIEPLKFARVSIDTSKTLRGENKKQWQVIFLNGNFGLPENLSDFIKSYGNEIEVGIALHGSEKFNLTAAYRDFPEIHKTFGQLPCIIQGPCTEPYIKTRSK